MISACSPDFLQHWLCQNLHFIWLNLEHCLKNDALLQHLLPSDNSHFESSVSSQKNLERKWSRALLRAALAEFYGPKASASEIVSGLHGKPSLKACPEVSFNLSHSRGQVFLGIGLGPAMGVDIELGLGSLQRCNLLAKRVLSNNETNVFLGLKNDANKVTYFNRVWSSKEALLKCLGTGILTTLTDLDVLGTYDPNLPFEKFTKSGIDISLKNETTDSQHMDVMKFDFTCFSRPFSVAEMIVCIQEF